MGVASALKPADSTEPAETPPVTQQEAETADTVVDEKYAREVLEAVAKAIDEVESKKRGPIRAQENQDSDADEMARRPDRARDGAPVAEGEWGSFALSESEEGLRPARSVSCGDPCEISGTTEQGENWTHKKRCVPGDRTKYTILLGGGDDEVVMSCAYGTAFSMETCDCTVRMIPKAEEA